MGKAAICSSRQAEREQFLPGCVEFDPSILRTGARAQVVVLGDDLALPERCRTCEKRLLKLVGHPRREIFTLGVGHFAAFDDRYDLVLLDRIAKPLAQLDDGSEQPDRDAGNTVAAGSHQAGDGAAAAENACLSFPTSMPAAAIC